MSSLQRRLKVMRFFTNSKASEKREPVLIPCGDFVRLQTSEKLLQLRKLFSDLDNVLSVHLQGHSMAKM